MQNSMYIKRIRAKICAVLERYPVKRAALFGAFARNEATPESDVNLLVELLENAPGIEFFGLKRDLEDALALGVDLVTYRALAQCDATLRLSVEKEAEVIYGK